MGYTRYARKKGLRQTHKARKAPLLRSVYTTQRGGAAPPATFPTYYVTTVAGIRTGGFNVATTATPTPSTNLLGTQLNTVRGTAQDLSGNVYIGARTCILKLSRPGTSKELFIYDTSQANPTFVPVPNAPTALFPGATISLFAGSSTAGLPSGTQTGATIRFTNINEIIYSPTQNCLYVSDSDANVVLKVTLGTTPTSTVYAGKVGTAGAGAPLAGALGTNIISYPRGLALDPDGTLYVGCFLYAYIMRISTSQVAIIVHYALSSYPGSLVLGSDGAIYFPGAYNGVVYRLAPTTYNTSTYAGVLAWSNWTAYGDGSRSPAKFAYPESMCGDSKGNMFV